MTPADLRLMESGENYGDDCTAAVDETLAVEPEPTHAELHARLKLSIELAKQEKRIKALETLVDRLNTRLAVRWGLPALTGEEAPLT